MHISSAHVPPGRPQTSNRPLVFGASGLVGGAIHARLRALGRDPVGTYRTHGKPGLLPLDLAEPDALARWAHGGEVGLVVMASAMTHVDRCETHPDEARR